MTDPFMESIAAALAGQAVVALSAAGRKALEKVRELVRGKSAEDPETHAALEAADDRPAEHPKVRALAERLDHLAEQDPEFARQLQEAGAEVHNELMAARDQAVVNQNSGNVGRLVQARDIHGGVNI